MAIIPISKFAVIKANRESIFQTNIFLIYSKKRITMKKKNKYIYGWKLWVNYGQGWEYEIFEETRQGYIENRKAYRENCTYPQKWTRARELNT
jgi:hypothetical protein